jgi:hypothetical protein
MQNQQGGGWGGGPMNQQNQQGGPGGINMQNQQGGGWGGGPMNQQNQQGGPGGANMQNQQGGGWGGWGNSPMNQQNQQGGWNSGGPMNQQGQQGAPGGTNMQNQQGGWGGPMNQQGQQGAPGGANVPHQQGGGWGANQGGGGWAGPGHSPVVPLTAQDLGSAPPSTYQHWQADNRGGEPFGHGNMQQTGSSGTAAHPFDHPANGPNSPAGPAHTVDTTGVHHTTVPFGGDTPAFDSGPATVQPNGGTSNPLGHQPPQHGNVGDAGNVADVGNVHGSDAVTQPQQASDLTSPVTQQHQVDNTEHANPLAQHTDGAGAGGELEGQIPDHQPDVDADSAPDHGGAHVG